MLENGCEVCNCKKTNCIRHGKCKECIEYHNQFYERAGFKRVTVFKRVSEKGEMEFTIMTLC